MGRPRQAHAMTETMDYEAAVRHVEHMRDRQYYLAPRYRMRLSVVSAAPLAAIARTVESHEAAAQLPIKRVTGVITRHSRFAHFDVVAGE